MCRLACSIDLPVLADSFLTCIHPYRLNRGGDRQTNAAIHVVALPSSRTDTRIKMYLARVKVLSTSRPPVDRVIVNIVLSYGLRVRGWECTT